MTKIRILVAARALATAEQVTLSIRALGYDVVDVVWAIDEAVASALHERPELVLIDASLCLEERDAKLDALAALGIPMLYVFAEDPRYAALRPSDRAASYLTMPFGLDKLKAAIERALGVNSPTPPIDVAALRGALLAEIVEPLEMVLASVERMSDLLTMTMAALDTCRDWIAAQQFPGPCPAILSRSRPPGRLATVDAALKDSFVVTLGLRRVLATARHLASEGGKGEASAEVRPS
jgi:hypothetical protein